RRYFARHEARERVAALGATEVAQKGVSQRSGSRNILRARALLRLAADELEARCRHFLRRLAELIEAVPQRSGALGRVAPHLRKLTEASCRKRVCGLAGDIRPQCGFSFRCEPGHGVVRAE